MLVLSCSSALSSENDQEPGFDGTAEPDDTPAALAPDVEPAQEFQPHFGIIDFSNLCGEIGVASAGHSRREAK